jgi:hypothetical protein
MSGDESFLPRWSRRKRSAAATARQSAKPENAADNAAPKTPATALLAERLNRSSIPGVCRLSIQLAPDQTSGVRNT